MRILVTGASGQLGGYLLRELAADNRQLVAWSGSRTGRLFDVPLQPVDLALAVSVAAAFLRDRPTTVIHAGALASVADCVRDPARARQVNVEGSAVLTELCATARIRLLYVSTDLVFDGERGGYRESDAPAPLSVYGRTKAEAEHVVLAYARGAVIRMSLLFGPTLVGRLAFFDQQMTALRKRKPMPLFEDEWRTPLDLATAARALVALTQTDFNGILHVGGPERLSRLAMGQGLAAALGADPSVFVAARREQIAAAEPRPRDASLDSTRWRELFPRLPWPTYAEALAELLKPLA